MAKELKYETEKRRKREERKIGRADQIKIKNTKFGKHNQNRFSHERKREEKKIWWVELNPCNKRIKFKLLKIIRYGSRIERLNRIRVRKKEREDFRKEKKVRTVWKW